MADVARIVDSANTNVEILKAAGDGARKRNLKIKGDYKRYLKAAERQVVENSVLLAIALSVMGPITRSKFERSVRKIDNQVVQEKEKKCRT